VIFPAYRSRYLPAMTRAAIAAVPDKERAPVIVAVGAIEQHGRHLPVAVDALMGQVWTTLVLRRLRPDQPCYVAPPITIGKSNEHTGFPGTLMLTKETLRQLLLCIARQCQAWGFRRLAIINTHGGNLPVLLPTLREIRAQFGMKAELLRSTVKLDVSAREQAFGIHAGEVETSWILAAANSLVDLPKAECEFFSRLEDETMVRPVAAPILRSWVAKDLSQSGVMGDATIATVEKGQRWLDAASESMAQQLVALGE